MVLVVMKEKRAKDKFQAEQVQKVKEYNWDGVYEICI